jgi:hypothetical protein
MSTADRPQELETEVERRGEEAAGCLGVIVAVIVAWVSVWLFAPIWAIATCYRFHWWCEVIPPVLRP